MAPGVPAGAASPAAPSSTATAPASSLGDLTTYGYGNARSDDDTVDPAISKLSAGPAWDDSLDAGVYGQPLVYDATVYVGTENDTVYAIGAKTGKVVWKLHVGTPASTSVVDSAPTLSGGCGDINPLGITGTPVIDAATDEIFAAEETWWAPTTGRTSSIGSWPCLWPPTRSCGTAQVDPPDGNQARHYYIPAEQQRPALTLWDGRIYVEFGGLDGDCGQYHGYVVSVPEPGRGPLVSYQVPTQREGAIWGTGGGFCLPVGRSVRRHRQRELELPVVVRRRQLGHRAVPNTGTARLLGAEQLGTAQRQRLGPRLGRPVPVPGTSLLFVAGKPAANGSFGYLMKVSPLGGIGKGAFTGALCLGGGAFGADATDVIRAGGREPHLCVRAVRQRHRGRRGGCVGHDLQARVVGFDRARPTAPPS